MGGGIDNVTFVESQNFDLKNKIQNGSKLHNIGGLWNRGRALHPEMTSNAIFGSSQVCVFTFLFIETRSASRTAGGLLGDFEEKEN